MAERIPKHIKLKANSEKSGLGNYYNEIHERAITLEQNLAPFNDTIDKAVLTLNNINDELDILYQRAEVLEQQRAELDGVISDARASCSKIEDSHVQALADYNKIFFKELAADFKIPELLDPDRSWTVDLNYFPAFGLIFICESIYENTENPLSNDDDDNDVSNWMNDVTK